MEEGYSKVKVNGCAQFDSDGGLIVWQDKRMRGVGVLFLILVDG